MIDPAIRQLEVDLGLKRLSPAWAKAEVFVGLACVWLSLHVTDLIGNDRASHPLISLGLFVGGGYLSMAGSRSHLYQSNNRLIAYLAGLLRRP